MADVLLSLGGNLGDPPTSIAAALRRLDAAGVAITARSRLFRTPPWGRLDQPSFVNLCAAAQTELPPARVLRTAKAVERALGRTLGERWGPRVIDIDILTYDDLVLATAELTLPHPHLTERAFVLVPLLDIAPGKIVSGRPISEWAAACDAAGIEPLSSPSPHPSSRLTPP